MNDIWFSSDHHFSHTNILTFKRDDGTPLRPFSSVEEMDETMIENWNKVVGENDRIYHLGDLAMHNRALNSIMPRLNGRKVLIKGNHDANTANNYLKYFDDIRAFDRKDNYILAHVPIHPSSLGRFRQLHGHLHYRHVLLDDGSKDERYFNVSVECHNYAPISLEQVKSYYAKSI